MMGLEEIVEANRAASLPGVDSVREYVADAVAGFVSDHPDTGFQRGYLAALLAVANEALQEDMTAEPYVFGQHILASSDPFRRNPPSQAWGPHSDLPADHPCRLFGKASRITVQGAV